MLVPPPAPLVVDLDDHHIVAGDDAVRAGERRNGRGAVDLEVVFSHQPQQGVETWETITDRVRWAIGDVKHLGPVAGRGLETVGARGGAAGEKAPEADGHEEPDRSHRQDAAISDQPSGEAAGRDQRRHQRRTKCQRCGGDGRLLARVGETARSGAAAQQQPQQGKEPGE